MFLALSHFSVTLPYLWLGYHCDTCFTGEKLRLPNWPKLGAIELCFKEQILLF